MLPFFLGTTDTNFMALNYSVNVMMGIRRLLPRRPFVEPGIFTRLKELQILKPLRGKKRCVKQSHGNLNNISVRITSRCTSITRPPYASINNSTLGSTVVNVNKSPSNRTLVPMKKVTTPFSS